MYFLPELYLANRSERRKKGKHRQIFSPTTIILSPATFEKVFGTMNSLGSLAKGVMNRAVSIPSDVNDVVMDNVMPLVDSLADTISNDADIEHYAKGEIRKRKLRTQGRYERPQSTRRYPEKRRVRRRKRIRKEKPGKEDADDRLRNHKIDFFSETMEKYLKHREMLAEGAMKVGQVDEFVSSLAEKIKKVGMEKELNDTVTDDLIAMPKVDILKTD